MFALNLPKFDIKVTPQNGKNLIFDILRRRYVTLTPEEWVRQHFVHYLIQHKGYPAGLLGNEISLSLNGTSKRCDSVLYGTDRAPKMIIEYKAPTVAISQNTFEQIYRYNMALRVNYLMVSNGLEHYCCYVDYAAQTCRFLPEIPSYDQL